MIELWRYVRSLFGVRYVRLTADITSSEEIRPVFWRNGEPCADFIGFGLRIVTLLDGGKLKNGNYVSRWEPYEPRPFGPRQWPSYIPHTDQ